MTSSLGDTRESQVLTYEQFKEEWLADVVDGDPSSVEKGHRFAIKLITQWLDVSADDQDLVLLDGSGDGGIDVAYLQMKEELTDDMAEGEEEGDTWYVIQSKYGTALQGRRTIYEEGIKVIDTLAGENKSRLAESTRDLLARLDEFRRRSSDQDKIILVFASVDPLTPDERDELSRIRILGNDRFPNLFDVQEVSVQTIWEQSQIESPAEIRVHLNADLEGLDDDLKVGAVKLIAMYEFLKDFVRSTGYLEQLYEQNVRQFLGGRRKINKGIRRTLETNPEHFGLFNNGITVVAKSMERGPGDSWILTNPYIVNGCQTTRTIWEVLKIKLDSGGTGAGAEDEWRERLERSIVVAKFVTSQDTGLLKDIVKFTNSQNAVREQDFVALEDDFRHWKTDFENEYGVFLEIQKGGWEAQRALQKSGRSQLDLDERRHANAFDLIKVIGSAFYDMAGAAFRTNKPFFPNAPHYRKITRQGEEGPPFDHRMLFAALLLKEQADRLHFGRAGKQQRRLTRFLFYMILGNVLRFILQTSPDIVASPQNMGDSIVKLGTMPDNGILTSLADHAASAVDDYMNSEMEGGAYEEEVYRGQFGQNLNQFLKSDQLGTDSTPNLRTKISLFQQTSRMAPQGGDSLATQVLEVLT